MWHLCAHDPCPVMSDAPDGSLAGPVARWLAQWSWTGCLIGELAKVLDMHDLGLIRRR